MQVKHSLAFDPGILTVNEDGSGDFVLPESAFNLIDDRDEGPDGPEGSIHWAAHIERSELLALRDWLNRVL